MSIKYVLHPGRALESGKPRYVGSRELARLYGVPINECVTPPDGERFSPFYYRDGLTHLHLRASGQYPNIGAGAPLNASDG